MDRASLYCWIISGSFFSINFYLKKENKTANLLLVSLLVLSALDLISIYLKIMGNIEYIPLISKLMFSSVYLYGPLIYNYTRIQTGSIRFPKLTIIYQLIPSLLAIIILLITDLNEFTNNPPIQFFFYIYTGYLYLIINLVLSLIKYFKFNRQIRSYFSSIEYIKQLWIRIILTGAMIVLIYNLYVDLFIESTSLLILESEKYTLITVVLAVIFISVVGVMALNQPEITLKVQKLNKSTSKYKNQNLTKLEAKEYADRILKALDKDKVYLEEDLSLDILSEKIDIEPHTISMVLNSVINTSFYTLINNYRIEESKRLLRENSNNKLTILEIAYQSGFNSKATFYSHFKRITGTTPTKFL